MFMFQTDHLALGAIPRSIWITLEDDLINSCKPGDDVVVNGIVKTRWHQLGRCVFLLYSCRYVRR